MVGFVGLNGKTRWFKTNEVYYMQYLPAKKLSPIICQTRYFLNFANNKQNLYTQQIYVPTYHDRR